MAWKKDDGALFRYISFTTESLSKIDDIELATLKIHLVFEDILKYLLATRLGTDDEVFFDARIDFATLLEIALAGIDNDHLRGALRALNRARNHVSHRVESPEFSKQIAVFVHEIAYMKGKSTKWPAQPAKQLRLLRESFDEAAAKILVIAINWHKRDD